MIVIDTSALVAIYANEPDAVAILGAIEASDRALVGTPNAFEFRLVAYKKNGLSGSDRAETILTLPPIELATWTPDLVAIATEALHRFGRRPARLNYGDCMAYALAKSLDAPLLYKGNDFAATDIRSAI